MKWTRVQTNQPKIPHPLMMNQTQVSPRRIDLPRYQEGLLGLMMTDLQVSRSKPVSCYQEKHKMGT